MCVCVCVCVLVVVLVCMQCVNTDLSQHDNGNPIPWTLPVPSSPLAFMLFQAPHSTPPHSPSVVSPKGMCGWYLESFHGRLHCNQCVCVSTTRRMRQSLPMYVTPAVIVCFLFVFFLPA